MDGQTLDKLKEMMRNEPKLMTDGNDMKSGPFVTFLHQLCSFST
jgi:hypothetical protein